LGSLLAKTLFAAQRNASRIALGALIDQKFF